MKRVVVTGLGIVASIGNNVKEVLDSLKLEKSGISFNKEIVSSEKVAFEWNRDSPGRQRRTTASSET